MRATRFGSDHRYERLDDRLGVARRVLEECTFCELRCRVDRTRNESCPCRLGAETYIYKRYVSLNEDASLAPALRVFFGGCNFRCRFCDEGPDCFQPEHGELVRPDELAAELEAAIDAGVKTISLIGGEPTLHPHTILAIAAATSRPLPLIVNSNMYMTPEVLDLLDGVVTEYLADFKFGNDACAKSLAGVPRYTEVVPRNLKHATKSAKVVVRHLLIPGHLDCCFRPVADWLAANLPTAPFQLYTGYVPCWKASGDERIGRLNSRTESEQAIEYMNRAGLADAVVMDGHRWQDASPKPSSSAEVSVTIGTDGRIYCHDLTPELAGVVGDLCCPRADGTGNARPDHADPECER